MSLRITDTNGVDLTAQPPLAQNAVADPAAGAPIQIQCLLSEDDPLPFGFINGSLNWNDGTLPVVYSGTSSGTITVSSTRNLAAGNYLVKVSAQSFTAPSPSVVSVNFPVNVQSSAQVSSAIPTYYGPILPKDNGYPNAEQWDWNSGVDLDILASSVKMLLLTSKGERVMLPDYGTNLRRLIFEAQVGLQSIVQQEITDAISKWEPRVALRAVNVHKTGDRAYRVDAIFASRLNQKTFNLPMTFST